MPTGSEKWPKAALGQDEVEKLAKTRSNRCVQVGWEWRRSEVGAWRTEDRDPWSAGLQNFPTYLI